jgi:hypothetical protein
MKPRVIALIFVVAGISIIACSDTPRRLPYLAKKLFKLSSHPAAEEDIRDAATDDCIDDETEYQCGPLPPDHEDLVSLLAPVPTNSDLLSPYMKSASDIVLPAASRTMRSLMKLCGGSVRSPTDAPKNAPSDTKDKETHAERKDRDSNSPTTGFDASACARSVKECMHSIIGRLKGFLKNAIEEEGIPIVNGNDEVTAPRE